MRTSTLTKSAAIASPSGVAGARGEQPDENGQRAREVAAEMKDVHCEGRAVVAPRRPVRDESSARVDADHDAYHRQREGVDVHLVRPVDQSEDRARRDHE